MDPKINLISLMQNKEFSKLRCLASLRHNSAGAPNPSLKNEGKIRKSISELEVHRVITQGKHQDIF